jgi:hypothetical protein
MCVTSEVGSAQAFTGAVPSGVAALSWDVAVSVGRQGRQAVSTARTGSSVGSQGLQAQLRRLCWTMATARAIAVSLARQCLWQGGG